MSPESSTDVPCRSLHSHLWSRWSPGPTICQTPTIECTTHRAFASASPTVWNSLPDNLRDSTVGPDQFQRELKTHLFACLLNISSTEVLLRSHAIQIYIYLLTYLVALYDIWPGNGAGLFLQLWSLHGVQYVHIYIYIYTHQINNLLVWPTATWLKFEPLLLKATSWLCAFWSRESWSICTTVRLCLGADVRISPFTASMECELLVDERILLNAERWPAVLDTGRRLPVSSAIVAERLTAGDDWWKPTRVPTRHSHLTLQS